jgi:hypothetical protein
MKRLLLLITVICLSTELARGQTSEENQGDVPPGWWEVPKTKTRIKLGGYVKFDLIHDFNAIESPDFFDVSKIPTDGSEGTSTHMLAKETRLYIDSYSPSKYGDVRVYVEGDFYGSGGSFRLRHAYVEIGDKLLAGQSWSNFMDENIIPPTLDFEKPAAYLIARHAMLRWKQKLTQDAYIAFALEEPSAKGEAPAATGHFESPLPDFTARYRITKKWGHIQLSGFAALIRYRYDAGGKEDVTLYGGNLSGQWNVMKNDKIIYQIVHGPGVDRFRGGLSTGLDSNENLKALTGTGITVGLQHSWSSAFTSSLVFNQGKNNSTSEIPDNNIRHTRYTAANFLWHFTNSGFVGVEYLWGSRENISGDDGTANRIQFSVKYGIN